MLFTFQPLRLWVKRGVHWSRQVARWETSLPRRYSDCWKFEARYIALFDYLLDANAAMSHLTQELEQGFKDRVQIPNRRGDRSRGRYDGTDEHNKQVVSKAVARMKKTAKELQKGRVKQNTNIISANE